MDESETIFDRTRGVSCCSDACCTAPFKAPATLRLDPLVTPFPTDTGSTAPARQWIEDEEIQSLMRRHDMAGASAAILDVFRQAIRYAGFSNVPVLITGETGTGKELIARAIHRLDPNRKLGPFVAVNCAAINPGLAETDFFGHRRGAFTGATRNREGLVRAAEGGALFLDEIGDLDVGLQARLLRVLQENSVLPVGEEREVAVNVRFIAATNQDLEGLVARRKFRADLFHRLCVLRLEIPPLRERPSDLELLIEHFIRRHHNVKGQARPAANADFVRALRQLELPGNARQVENLVCLALANHHDEGELSLSDLPAAVLGQLADAVDQGAVHLSSATTPSQDGLQQLAPDQMCESVILERAGWNLSRAMNEFERRVLAIAMLLKLMAVVISSHLLQLKHIHSGVMAELAQLSSLGMVG